VSQQTVLFGLVALAAVGLAHCAPRRVRFEAVVVSVALFCDWCAYVLAWSWLSPAKALSRLGLDAHSIDLWSINDALVCLLALIIVRRNWGGRDFWQSYWWAMTVSGALFVSCYLYVLKWGGWISPVPFYRILDFLFLAEEVAIITIGGGPLATRLIHMFGPRSGVRRLGMVLGRESWKLR
jgi:hypothetical protein